MGIPPSIRSAAFAFFLLAALSPTRAVAENEYYWNAPSGTSWTAPGAWQLNSPTGPPVTWANDNRAVFSNDSAGVATLDSNVVATDLLFAGTASFTIAPVTGSAGSLTLTRGGISGWIVLTTSAPLVINAPLGGIDILILPLTSEFTSPTLQLGGANIFTGNLSIGTGGQFTSETTVVRLASAGAIPSTAAIRFAGRNAAVVFDQGMPAIHTLPNNIELNASGATVGQSNAFRAAIVTRVSFDGIISGTDGLIFSVDPNGGVSGTGSVFVLTRANTYAGGTFVNNGITLLVNNPLSGTDTATGTGGVVVGGRIGGTGLIAGVDSATNDGLRFGGVARLAPGDPAVNGGIGQLQVTRNVGWIAGGTYEVQLGGLTDTDANRDQLLTAGILRLDTANARINVDVSKIEGFEFTPGETYTYRIARANDGIMMFGGAGGQFDPSRFVVTSSFADPTDFSLSYEDGAGTENYLVLTYLAPVPEPNLILLGCALVVGAFSGARRLLGRH